MLKRSQEQLLCTPFLYIIQKCTLSSVFIHKVKDPREKLMDMVRELLHFQKYKIVDPGVKIFNITLLEIILKAYEGEHRRG